MLYFPEKKYPAPDVYAAEYFQKLAEASATIDLKAVAAASQVLLKTIRSGGRIYSCGNGGSSAIADHLACDFLKGIRTGTQMLPQALSLVSTTSLVTAIGNDFGYEQIFRFQLESLAKPGDTLLVISSSGNSPNIIQALTWAKANQISSVALTGFTGGEASQLADVNVQVKIANYGIVEDLHQSIMHLLAQYLRQAELSEDAVGTSTF